MDQSEGRLGQHNITENFEIMLFTVNNNYSVSLKRNVEDDPRCKASGIVKQVDVNYRTAAGIFTIDYYGRTAKKNATI